MTTCEQCGAAFDPVNQRPSHPAKFCSRACSHQAQRDRVTLTCRQCGQVFHRKAYMAKWSQERGPFCGFDCYGAWQAENCQGPANPNHREDANSRGAWKHSTARQAALERDQFHCCQCGSDDRLNVHHLDDPDDHALGNLETLCDSCHRKRHPVPHGPDGRFQTIR